uniref:Uncharacterized protein n=1 Tax=Caenorhabditis japonica TaxID=281687 RepID=A0A8R1J1E9_CAEJA
MYSLQSDSDGSQFNFDNAIEDKPMGKSLDAMEVDEQESDGDYEGEVSIILVSLHRGLICACSFFGVSFPISDESSGSLRRLAVCLFQLTNIFINLYGKDNLKLKILSSIKT